MNVNSFKGDSFSIIVNKWLESSPIVSQVLTFSQLSTITERQQVRLMLTDTLMQSITTHLQK